MSNDLLIRIGGLSDENLVSETLAYILRDRSYAPYQRLFYEYLFDDHHWPSNTQADLDVETRKRISEYGVPDIIITGRDMVILIENKFNAEYKPNQLSRYYSLLRERKEWSQLGDKFLVLLTPANRVPLYMEWAVDDFAQSIFPGISGTDSLTARMLDSGVKFKIMEWEEIIKRFESTDILVSSLVEYINEYYIGEVKFMLDELKALESTAYAQTLAKLIKAIDRIVERVRSDTSDTKMPKTLEKADFYGYSIYLKRCEVWFGFCWSLSRTQSPPTPLFLQLKPDWITDDKVDREKLGRKIQGIFILDKEHGYLKAYPVSCLANLDAFAETLRKDLRYLDDACLKSI